MDTAYPVGTVCRVLDVPRSTTYHRRSRDSERSRPGPATEIGDEQLVRAIRLVLENSAFCGEGYRKGRARLRRERGIHTSGKRVLRLMRRAGLLAPQRARRRRTPRPHTAPSSPLAADVYAAAIAGGGWHIDHLTRRCRELTGVVLDSRPRLGLVE